MAKNPGARASTHYVFIDFLSFHFTVMSPGDFARTQMSFQVRAHWLIPLLNFFQVNDKPFKSVCHLQMIDIQNTGSRIWCVARGLSAYGKALVPFYYRTLVSHGNSQLAVEFRKKFI